MNPLVVVLLLATPQERSSPETEPAWSRTLAIRNLAEETLPAGIQVAVRLGKRTGDPEDAADVAVFHKGKPLATWASRGQIWFRAAAPILPQDRDEGYEVRYGGGPVQGRPREVFEFFDCLMGMGLDRARWDWDPGLTFQPDVRGLAITAIPVGRSERTPASLAPRLPPLPESFVLEADLRWEITERSGLTFAVRAELALPPFAYEDQGKHVADLIKQLEEEDIETRERATRDLIKMGRPAISALREAIQSRDAEARSRAALAINGIYVQDPPWAASAGFTACEDHQGGLNQILFVGNGRPSHPRRLGRMGCATITLERFGDGWTQINWSGQNSTWVRTPGKVDRVRLDFWSSGDGYIGAVWVSRVILRRPWPVMPVAEWGPEEALR